MLPILVRFDLRRSLAGCVAVVGLLLAAMMIPFAPAGARAAPGVPDAPGSSNDTAASAARPDRNLELPGTVRGWSWPGESESYGPETLFDYMNGGAEIYLGYRFDHVDVYEYTAPSSDEDDILVEIYWMDTSDDAFGMLSYDWNGEPVVLGAGDDQRAADVEARAKARAWHPYHRATYRGGTLRIWSNDLFARVMAYEESEAAREAVLELGRAVVAGRSVTAPPAMYGVLPARIDDDLALEDGSICYLRSHHVLNALYFVDTANVLGLGHRAEAVLGRYRVGEADAAGDGDTSEVARVLLVRYPHSVASREAAAGLVGALPPDGGQPQGGDKLGADGDSQLVYQHGGRWWACRQSGRHLAVALDVDDEAHAQSLVDAAIEAIGGDTQRGD